MSGDASFDTSSPCAWVSLMTFMACIACVILMPPVPIFPRWSHIKKLYNRLRRGRQMQQIFDEEPPHVTVNEPIFYWLTLDMATAPIICLLVLFCTTCLSWDVFVSGIVGDDKIRPYGVVILFMSLSYICISLDVTGLFEHLSKLIIIKSNKRAHLLFIFFSIFASVLTLFTSNDIVILTLTPICCYLAKNAQNLDLIPFVITQFFLANTWSVAFQIGNPTNMIVAEAYKMNFLTYFLWMGLPALFSGISYFIILYLVFYRRIPDKIIKKSEGEDESISVLKDRRGAIIKSFGTILCLAILAIASIIPLPNNQSIPSYLICLISFILFFGYDCVLDVSKINHEESLRNALKFVSNATVAQVTKRMPWKIIPFVFGMFVMVELLNSYGLVTLIANNLSNIITNLSSINPESTLLSIASTCYVISILSALACNILNNQPMTILFTKVLTSNAYLQNETLQKASSLSLILGSNLGANLTLIGALAGIMWIQILRDHGIAKKEINYFKFLMYGICVTPIVLIIATSVIVIEIFIIETR